jgi:hypothetical protein
VDRHRVDADPDPTLHYHVDPDSDPDPTLIYTQVGKSEFLCHNFRYFGQHIEVSSVHFVGIGDPALDPDAASDLVPVRSNPVPQHRLD